MQTLNSPADLCLQVRRLPGQFRKLRIILLNSFVICALETPRVQGANLGSYFTVCCNLFGD